MKKVVCSIILLCISNLLFAQVDPLLGKWKIDKIISKKIYDYATKVVENPELMDEDLHQEIIDEEALLQIFVDKGSFIEIKPKNVFILGLYNFVADEVLLLKTSWFYMDKDKKAFNIAPQEVKKVIKNKKGVKITARNAVDYTIYQIIELSENRLKLFIEKEGVSFELSPAK